MSAEPWLGETCRACAQGDGSEPPSDHDSDCWVSMQGAEWAAANIKEADVTQLDSAPMRRMVLTPLSEIKLRRVTWLWEGRLALGTLGLLAGREGLGKSTLAYWLAARITRGELVGEYAGTPKSVLVCATEDSYEHTIGPRLVAAGADLTRVYRVEMVTYDDIHLGLSLPRDLAEVREAAEQTDAALLLLDPLMSRLGDSLDTHRDGDVRRALEPLVSVADETGMSILGLMHHNKSGATDPLQLVMGSKAFTAVARSVHTVVPDPDDETDTRRFFGTPKNNLGTTNLSTLAFTIASAAVETDDGPTWTGRIEWGEEISESIAETMRKAAEGDEDRSAAGEAADWLEDWLTDQGGTAPSKDIKAAGKKADHSLSALQRARKKLKIITETSGFPRQSFWTLPVVSSTVDSTPRGEETTEMNGTTGAIEVPAETTEAQSFQSFQSFETGVAPEITGVCSNRNHSPKMRGARWICTDCEENAS
jgi:hypothetical protein